MRLMREEAEEKGWVGGEHDDVGLSFDSLTIRGQALLRNGTLLGYQVRSNFSVVETEFRDIVRKYSDFESESASTTLADNLVQTREHFVVYATALHPGNKLCFIAAAYNLCSIKSHNVDQILNDVTIGLYGFGWKVRTVCGDGATSNTTFFRSACDIPVRRFIPEAVLDQYGVDKDFKVAYSHPITDEPIFVVEDPPHAIKKGANSLRNRKMFFGCFAPINIEILKNIWLDIDEVEGGDFTNVSPETKFKLEHFDALNHEKMRVYLSAQLFSNTMVGMIDRVCKEPWKYPRSRRKLGNSSSGITGTLAPLREFCVKMNRFFDLCNSKDPARNNPFVKITPNNGASYAAEFLEIAAWFDQWKNSIPVTDSGKMIDEKMFLTREAYTSIKSACLGFACLIYYKTIERGHWLSLCKINQDVCEHHFANLRQMLGCHSDPTQAEAMRGKIASTAVRHRRVQGSNCSSKPQDTTKIPLAKKRRLSYS
jgi:hypothetical protein